MSDFYTDDDHGKLDAANETDQEGLSGAATQLQAVEQSLLSAIPNMLDLKIQSGENYLRRLKEARSSLNSLAEKHKGEPYMTSDLEDRIDALLKRVREEIPETKRELDDLRRAREQGDDVAYTHDEETNDDTSGGGSGGDDTSGGGTWEPRETTLR